MPSLAEAVTRTFVLGEASRLQLLFSEAGFADIRTSTVKNNCVVPSFDAIMALLSAAGLPLARRSPRCPSRYAAPCARKYGAASPTRRTIGVEVEHRIANGRR